MNTEERRADLIAKVKELMEDMTNMAVERIERNDQLAQELLRAHDGRQWLAPRLYVVAFAEEIKRRIDLPYPTDAQRKLVQRFDFLL